MVSTTSILAMAAAVATTVDYVQAHGYIAKPAPSWKDKETNDWVVEIEPQWKGGWDESKGDEGLLATFKELAPKNNYKDVRSLMDGNPVYGEDCGFTDPKGTPSEPPSDGTATFSRGIVHAGPCEIWLDDKMVLQNDDCQSAYGDGTQKTISVFKPVDYSSCASGGCMLRFYWLALQRLDGKTVWQGVQELYPPDRPCRWRCLAADPVYWRWLGHVSEITRRGPLADRSFYRRLQQEGRVGWQQEGGQEGRVGWQQERGQEGGHPSGGDSPSSPETPPSGGDSPETPPSGGDSPATPAPETPSAETPEMSPVPAPSSKCNGRRRRRY
ncbi:hypothetical protein AM588_10004452 [Phytophthora nicotianae]|uniref:Uncharacterized protein n=1 Tax=Phytophthora nicotianae TaxID=4792 RepID=A0A0W8DCT4_PHYNI|nr:hypothetical protein AM588_10004452 [Phytophthora nicotianae]